MSATDTALPTKSVTTPMPMSGGRVLAEMLRLHGVGPMFGIGGFQLLPFYGAVHELGLVHYLVNDERTGVFAADAYARVTGRVGVCDATLGPGATNLVTGLVESLNAGIPLVVLVGDTERTHIGKHMTQEADQVSILRYAVKHLIRIEIPQRIPELVRRAFALATSGRPGPIVLDIPEDVSHAVIHISESDLWADLSTTCVPGRGSRPDERDVDEAATLLARAERPVVLVGGGVHLSSAYAPLQRFVEALNAPVAHTISGKGAIADTHPLSVGVFGRYSRTANDLIEEADVLVAVGTKLGEIATKRYGLIPDRIPLIHLEVDPQEVGRTARTAVALVGDAGLSLDDLYSASKVYPQADRRTWAQEIVKGKARWRAEVDARLTTSERPINVARLVHELNNVIPADSVMVADGGFAAHWAALLYDTKRAGRTFIADRGFASIGYGLPGALGAALGVAEGTKVVGMTGDGGFNMALGELETAARIGRPFVIVVVNNAASGYVKALQHIMLGGVYQSSDLSEINYARVALAIGCAGFRVEDPNDLAGTLHTALNCGQPAVVDVVVTRDPGKMLPGVDNRLEQALKNEGGRIL